MELDGFSSDLGLAFEYHGEQHYTANTHFIKSAGKLRQRIADDALKVKLCDKYGVKVLVIPQIPTRLKAEDLRQFLFDKLKKLGVKLPSNFLKKIVNLSGAYSPGRLGALQGLAEARGGQLLSSFYGGLNIKHDWVCKKGHKWSATPSNVKGGTWCPDCANATKNSKRKLTIEEMQNLAAEKGGACNSSVYVDANTKLSWTCSKKHTWDAKPAAIKRGHWCPKCAGKTIGTIEEMRELAAKYGGKCVSKEYLGRKSYLVWKCRNGHSFEKRPANVLRGQWCRACRELASKSK
jgi:thiol-disulfide isomerase/thioredoxin